MKIYADLSGKVNANCYTQGRDGQPVLVLVCHNTAGPGDFNTAGQSPATAQALSDQAANYLTNNDRQVSIHWVVGAEACGAPIYRVVPETSTAYHCGGTPPQFPSHWVNPDDGQAYGRFGLNEVAIGIELFGQVWETPGPNQMASLKALVQDIASRYPILKKPGHIVAHKELEGDRTDGVNWVNQAKVWVTQDGGNTGNNGGNNVGNLPYGVQLKADGGLYFPSTNATINWGFKDYFLSLGGQVPQGNDLAAAINRAVFVFGLPLADEIKLYDANKNQIGATQPLELYFLKYDTTVAAPYNIRGAFVQPR